MKLLKGTLWKTHIDLHFVFEFGLILCIEDIGIFLPEALKAFIYVHITSLWRHHNVIRLPTSIYCQYRDMIVLQYKMLDILVCNED